MRECPPALCVRARLSADRRATKDVLAALVVEPFPGESAMESFEAQARDVEEPSHRSWLPHRNEPVPPSSKVMSTRLSLTL